MAFLETRASGSRIVLNGECPVEITLAEACQAGDCLGIDTATWVLSAHADAEEPLLIASVDAPSGAIIKAYPIAAVEVTTTSGNKSTLGEIVALKDDGLYQVESGGLPDVGFSYFVGSDSLTAKVAVFPMGPQLTQVRT